LGRACAVCGHAERDEIDRRLVAGEAYRDIARQFQLSKDSLARHRPRHLSPALVKVAAAREEARGEALLDQVQALIARGQRIADRAEQNGRDIQALAAIRELRPLLELLGRLTGELKDRPAVTVNVLTLPEWSNIRSKLLAALLPHPEARAAAASALAELEAAG
jgi:hypothetical protein